MSNWLWLPASFPLYLVAYVRLSPLRLSVVLLCLNFCHATQLLSLLFLHMLVWVSPLIQGIFYYLFTSTLSSTPPPIHMTSLTLSHLFSSDFVLPTLSHLISSHFAFSHLLLSNLIRSLPLSSPPRCVPTPCFPSPPRRYRETTTLLLPLLQSICGLWECCFSSCAQVR